MTLYFERLAAAFVRGTYPEWNQIPLDEDDWESRIQTGLERGLRIHRFKRTMDLPRVQKVLGILQGLYPGELLDLGPGRGAFLWPLLDRFPDLPVQTVDRLDYRVADIQTVQRGGVAQLASLCGEVEQLPFLEQQFDVTTMLEVLEHTPNPQLALQEVARVTRRALVISVPSQADDNPEHLHLFQPAQLQQWLTQLGFSRLNSSGVLNHHIVVATR